MTKTDIEALATKIFLEVNAYVKRSMGGMREYIDLEIGKLKAHSKELNSDLGAHFEARLKDSAKEHAEAQPETIKSLERRASRHAEHLARLEDRVKSLEHSGK